MKISVIKFHKQKENINILSKMSVNKSKITPLFNANSTIRRILLPHFFNPDWPKGITALLESWKQLHFNPHR